MFAESIATLAHDGQVMHKHIFQEWQFLFALAIPYIYKYKNSVMRISKEENRYIPGTCNIGPKEIQMRKKASIAAGIFCAAAMAFVLLFDVDKYWRLLLFFPASGFAVTFQQWYNKFCVAFGMKGVFNFGEMGKTFSVEQQENFKQDRIRAWKMIVFGVVFGLVTALVFFFLP